MLGCFLEASGLWSLLPFPHSQGSPKGYVVIPEGSNLSKGSKAGAKPPDSRPLAVSYSTLPSLSLTWAEHKPLLTRSGLMPLDSLHGHGPCLAPSWLSAVRKSMQVDFRGPLSSNQLPACLWTATI